MSKILLNACIIIGDNRFITSITTLHILAKVKRNWAVGVVGLMTMRIYLPIGSLLMIPNNLYQFLTFALHIYAQINALLIIHHPPFAKGASKHILR